MMIDFHAHTFPSKIAEGVLQKLQKLSRSKPYTDGTTEEHYQPYNSDGSRTHRCFHPAPGHDQHRTGA